MSGLDVILAVTRKQIPMKIVATSAMWRPTQLEMVKYAGADAVLPKSPSPVHFSESQWLACIRAQVPAEGTSRRELSAARARAACLPLCQPDGKRPRLVPRFLCLKLRLLAVQLCLPRGINDVSRVPAGTGKSQSRRVPAGRRPDERGTYQSYCRASTQTRKQAAH